MHLKQIVSFSFISLTMVVNQGLVSVSANETISEKTEATAKTVKRSLKKGLHRTTEAVCMKSDAACLRQKAKHKAAEAREATGDKVNEIVNSVD